MTKLLLEGQGLHLAGLLLLVPGAAWAAWRWDALEGELWGGSTRLWFVLVISNAIAHQLWVWLCWRCELHLGLLSSWFGRRAFTIYAAVFTVLILARPVLAFVLSASNRGSLPWDPAWSWLAASALAVPAIWCGYSVVRFFSFRRAYGIDHFDESMRGAPLVRRGIFGVTSNAMYVFGFFILWVPAVGFASKAGLIAAAFSHAYIWVHYFATEQPDMRRIYGS